jgi:hypothetical protein
MAKDKTETKTEKITKIENVDDTKEVKANEVPKENRNFVIAENILSATISYLYTRPYSEVAGLVQALSQSRILN